MRGMNCKRAAEFLPLYAAGDLDGARSGEVASHLVACEGCRRIVGEFVESRALLAEAFETPEFGAEFYAGIRSSVLARISRDREPSTPPFAAALFGRRLAYATAFAVALFAAAFSFQHFRGGVRESPRELAHEATQTADTPQRVRPGDTVSSPQPDGVKGSPTPPRAEVASSPRRDTTRRGARDRPREPTPKTVVPDDEGAMTARVAPQSIDGARGAGESASPASGSASASANAVAPEVSRIEIQTADPNIRIIWLTPKVSEAPDPNEPQNENGERK